MDRYRNRLAKTEALLAARLAQLEPSAEFTSVSNQRSGRQYGRKQSSAIGFDVCRRCGAKGHWAKECPMAGTIFNQATGPVDNSTSHSRANVFIATKRADIRVYVQIMYSGKLYRALLDTGCDVSVIGTHMLPDLTYQECNLQLYAANSSAVSIKGSTDLKYSIVGVDMKYNVLVSPSIDEIIFGADWLNDHQCIWDFTAGMLYI